jgi:phosphate transport system substrate-binding protein
MLVAADLAAIRSRTISGREDTGVKRILTISTIALLAVAMLALAACGSPSSTTTGGSSSGGSTTFTGAALVGAGATFPAPVYQSWAKAFNGVESDAKVNYQPIGSGGGVQQFIAKTVDFGATDVSLVASETAKITSPYIQFPTCLGAVVVAYNLPGLSAPLKLDGPTTAKIFLGTVTKWNDPAIAALNAGVTLPSTPIQVVHRADGSGTTSIFTKWLKGQSPEWDTKVGAGKSVQWPVGQGGNGNAGVAASMKQTAGSIGYLELQFAASSGLPVASVKAPDGSFVEPTVDSVAKAGEGLTFPITEKTSILDSKTTGAYPISSTTYVLIYKEQADKAKAQTLVDFWTWALTKGQTEVTKLNYAPLPAKVQADSLNELTGITAGGAAITASPSVK